MVVIIYYWQDLDIQKKRLPQLLMIVKRAEKEPEDAEDAKKPEDAKNQDVMQVKDIVREKKNIVGAKEPENSVVGTRNIKAMYH